LNRKSCLLYVLMEKEKEKNKKAHIATHTFGSYPNPNSSKKTNKGCVTLCCGLAILHDQKYLKQAKEEEEEELWETQRPISPCKNIPNLPKKIL